MTNDPIEFVSEAVPGLFNAGAKEMKAAADQGDADAKRRVSELQATTRAVRVALEGKGGGDVYLLIKGGEMTSSKSAPSEAVTLTIAAPAEALEIALDEMGEEIEKGFSKGPKRLARLSANRVTAFIDRLVGEKLKLHYVVKDTPDFDEVRVKIGFGAELAEKPLFTVAVDYDTLEEIRERKLKPQALMGRLQITGDAARAMQLGMELMQR
ncbi:MAG: SCP2 sterol-binding domain-containing protein [Myxococcales bacterium]